MSSEDLQVNADDLRRWAVAHDQAAEAIVAARQECDHMLEHVRSWGPMYHEARRAAIDAVNARAAALDTERQRHEDMAQQLRVGAQKYAAMQTENTAGLKLDANGSTNT